MPGRTDDMAASKDGDWQPTHDFDAAFADYLIPLIRERYWLN
ncbi:MAG: hypothetical protein ACETWB_05700 [Anaerolineae bacterium]